MSSIRLRKRRILVVEDNELNREILSAILEEEFEVLTAENGKIGLEILAKHYRDLSLVLLDVYMPVCNGFEFLEKVQRDVLLSNVPIIVTTGSNAPKAEVRCLKAGASDFITKPYNPEVVMARIHSIIRLRESEAALSAVEFDKVTGLYTMPAFYHHAQSILSAADTDDFELVVCDLQDFKLVNSVFGEKTGDEVLAYLGGCLRNCMPDSILARQGDKFFILYRQGQYDFQKDILPDVTESVRNSPVANLKIKYGIYQRIEKSQPVSILCDRVVIAVVSIKQDYMVNVILYDEAIQNRLLEAQRMEDAFDEALENHEFKVWYQPKVDTYTGEIVAAEALVRWFPFGGNMISPGVFIPLFENDGLISRLDEYVFRMVCRFQKERLKAGKRVVPISINLSRNTLYQKGTLERYLDMVKELEIPKGMVPIELTESAAMEGKLINRLTEQFQNAGFELHMDDFGTGYSSLAALSTMPFEVVKLDKSLIDQIGTSKGDTIVRSMIFIAKEMGMRIVAEGVEKKEQVEFLRDAGCDMIQGFFFSPPKKQEEFENLL